MLVRILVTGGAGFIGSNYVHHVLHTRAGAPADCCPDHVRYATGKAAPARGEKMARQGKTPRGGKTARDGKTDLRILNLDKMTYAADPANLHGVDKHPAYGFAKVDITDAAAVEAAFKRFQPDIVVHFAAESHVDRSIEAGDVFVKTNVLGTQTLLDAARRHDVGQFLHVSTDEVYGSREKGSFKETDGFHCASPYSASKAGSDLLVLAHHRTYGLKATITRCTNNYGPRQHREKLLPKVITLAAEGKPIPIYGTGMNVRDWLYVKDHCTAIDQVLALNDWGGVYNVAARDEKPNLDVVRAVLKRLKKPESLITLVKDRPGHDWRYSLDDSKLRAKGWAPRTSFQEGLSDTIAWQESKQ